MTPASKAQSDPDISLETQVLVVDFEFWRSHKR